MVEWKDIQGYCGVYQINKQGAIKSFQRSRHGKHMKLRTDRCGYKEVKLWKNGKDRIFRVNRLVYCTFNNLDIENNDPKKKHLILHKNDIRDDNRLENLFIGSQKDNIQDCSNKGRHPSQNRKK